MKQTLAQQLVAPEVTHIEGKVSPETYEVLLEWLGNIWTGEAISAPDHVPPFIEDQHYTYTEP